MGRRPHSGDTKHCNGCNRTLSLDAFHKHSGYKSGVQSRCKECQKQADAARYAADGEAVKAKKREQYDANRDAELERQRKWREENPDKWRASYQSSREKNRDEVNAKQAERARERRRVEAEAREAVKPVYPEGMKPCPKCKTVKSFDAFGKDKRTFDGMTNQCKACRKAQFAEWQATLRAEDPERARLRDGVRKHRRRAAKAGGGGSHTNEEWLALCARYGHKCLCCGTSASRRVLTRDHVFPINQGGSNNIDNLQPLCLNCNCSKGDRHIDYRSPDKEVTT